MTKMLFIILLFASTSAMAEEKMAPAASPVSPPPMEQGGKEQSFEERKAEIIKRSSERQACIQASATPDAMKACFQGGMQGEKQEIKFEDRKAEMAKRIGDTIAEMQKKQSCIQAATDEEALKACLPKMGSGMMRHGGPEGK